MSRSLPVVIFGAGSLARMAHHIATNELGLTVLCFAVDPQYYFDSNLNGVPIVDANRLKDLYPPGTVSLFVAVGYRSFLQRADAWRRFSDADWDTINLVSANAYVAPTVTLGRNLLIMPGVVLEPGITIGDNNVFWSNTTICHDSIIGSDNFFAASTTVGGEVNIGSRCFFGFSSTVLQNRKVDSDVLIAAGALLTSNATRLGTYMGVPARRINDISPEVGICLN